MAVHDEVAKARAARRPIAPTLPLLQQYPKHKKAIARYFSELIRSRGDAELSYDDLGKKLGISKSAFSHKMNGRSALGLLEAIALADYLNEDLLAIVSKVTSIEVGANSSGSAPPAGMVDEANVQRAWEVIGKEFPTAGADERMSLALKVAKRLSASASEDEVVREVKAYVLNLAFNKGKE